ncbi:MAG: hypothetical protein NTU97_01530 [Candidatus Magasanikbacteria bacterium]|nr:hypothetical protein [Candidatus Magasanikbacteria bacterium]
MPKREKTAYLGQTRHHINPTSRGFTDDENIVMLPDNWHKAYHVLFGNLTLDEVHRFLETVMTPGKSWKKKALLNLIEKTKLDPPDDEEEI